MAPDGRILGEVDAGQGQADFAGLQEFQQMRIVLNWFEELKQRVPTN